MTNHTPTPWRKENSSEIVDNQGNFIAECCWQFVYEHNANGYQATTQEKANAEFIVKACNCHKDLLSALKIAEDLLSTVAIDSSEKMDFIRKIIAKAEGKK